MRFLVLILFIISIPAHARFWYVSPVVSHGEMKKGNDDSIPRYKQGTNEYNILQLCLDIENLMPTYIDPQYEKIFLDNIPPSLHAIVKSRNKRNAELTKLKTDGAIVENTDGLVKSSEAVAPSNVKDVVKEENADRTEMFSKICAHVKLKDKDCNIVSSIFAQGIKNHKYYALIEENSARSVDLSNTLTSMASNYNYRKVWMAILAIMKTEGFTTDSADLDDVKGLIVPHYICNAKEKKSFVIKLCAVKGQKLVECVHQNKDSEELKYAPIQDGTMIWVENDSSKSLIVSDDQEIYLCKGSKQKFDLLEKLSMQLLANEKNQNAPKARKKK